MFNNQLKKDILAGVNLFSFNKETQRLQFRYAGEIKEAIENAYLKNFPDLNLDESTPQGQQITTLTQTFNACIDYLESCGTAFFMGGSGLFLDYWADTLFNLKRKEAQPARVQVLIRGIVGTAIPEGFKVADNEYQYILTQKNVKIQASGYVIADFEMTEANSYVAPENTITEIITQVKGVEKVTNPFASIAGYKKESDFEFYTRAVKFNSTAKNGSFRSILANVASTPKVRRVSGYENVESKEVEFKGQTIPAHCFAIVAEGGDDFQVVSAIMHSKGVGAGAYGDIELEVWNNKEKYTYGFFRPTYVPLKFKVVLDQSKVAETTAKVVQQNIIDYCNNIDIGSIITQPNLVNACYKGFTEKDFIVSLEFSKKESDLSYTDIAMKFKEVPITSSPDIAVTQRLSNNYGD